MIRCSITVSQYCDISQSSSCFIRHCHLGLSQTYCSPTTNMQSMGCKSLVVASEQTKRHWDAALTNILSTCLPKVHLLHDAAASWWVGGDGGSVGSNEQSREGLMLSCSKYFTQILQRLLHLLKRGVMLSHISDVDIKYQCWTFILNVCEFLNCYIFTLCINLRMFWLKMAQELKHPGWNQGFLKHQSEKNWGEHTLSL